MIISNIQNIYSTNKIFTYNKSIKKKKLLLYLKKTLNHKYKQYHNLNNYYTYLSKNLTITKL